MSQNRTLENQERKTVPYEQQPICSLSDAIEKLKKYLKTELTNSVATNLISKIQKLIAFKNFALFIPLLSKDERSALDSEIVRVEKFLDEQISRALESLAIDGEFRDVIYSVSLALAKADPINPIDPCTQEPIEEKQAFFTSDRYQFDSASLFNWIKTSEKFINPLTGNEFKSKDIAVLKKYVTIEEKKHQPQEPSNLDLQAIEHAMANINGLGGQGIDVDDAKIDEKKHSEEREYKVRQLTEELRTLEEKMLSKLKSLRLVDEHTKADEFFKHWDKIQIGIDELKKENLSTYENQKAMLADVSNANVLAEILIKLHQAGILNEKNRESLVTRAHRANLVIKEIHLLLSEKLRPLDDRSFRNIIDYSCFQECKDSPKLIEQCLDILFLRQLVNGDLTDEMDILNKLDRQPFFPYFQDKSFIWASGNLIKSGRLEMFYLHTIPVLFENPVLFVIKLNIICRKLHQANISVNPADEGIEISAYSLLKKNIKHVPEIFEILSKIPADRVTKEEFVRIIESITKVPISNGKVLLSQAGMGLFACPEEKKSDAGYISRIKAKIENKLKSADGLKRCGLFMRRILNQLNQLNQLKILLPLYDALESLDNEKMLTLNSLEIVMKNPENAQFIAAILIDLKENEALTTENRKLVLQYIQFAPLIVFQLDKITPGKDWEENFHKIIQNIASAVEPSLRKP